MALVKVEDIAKFAGREVEDEYGRVLGWLVSFQSNVDGTVEYIDVKVADKFIERISAERIKVKEGRLIVIPEWKHFSLKVIEALDRAYRRRRALETLANQNDIPADVVDIIKKKVTEEIKKLKLDAQEASKMIKERIRELEDETLKLAGSIANLQILYFSGELDDKGYTQSINHLRRLKDAASQEKADAKKVQDRLEKTLEAATAVERKPVKTTTSKSVTAPAAQASTMVVKVEEG